MRKYYWVLLLLVGWSSVVAGQPSVVVLTSDFVLPGKFHRLQSLAAGQQVNFHYLYAGAAPAEVQQAIAAASLLVLDGPRPSDMAAVVAMLPDGTAALTVPWLQIGGGRPAAGGLPVSDARQLTALYSHGGESNFRQFFAYARALAEGRQPVAVKPQLLAAQGIYHPERLFDDLDSFMQFIADTDKPLAGFIISSSLVRNMQTRLLDEIFRTGRQQGFLPVLFWFDDADPQGLAAFWGQQRPVALINLTHLQQGEARKAEFKQLDRPVIQAFIYRDGAEQHWRKASSGIATGTAATLMAVPEGWGMTDPLVVAALEQGEPVAIRSQLALLYGRLHSLHRLQVMPAAGKRLALLFWNTPAGAENIAASNLNVPASLARLTASLQQAGYHIRPRMEQEAISTAKQLLSGLYQPETLPELAGQGLALTLPLAQYLQWFRQLPLSVQQDVSQQWGEPEQHALLHMVDGQQVFVFPAVWWDNLLLMPQVPRAGTVGAATHDTKIPPDHYYLAAYYMLQQQSLQALIHFGTHGSQEWTPGKDRGLADTDYPFLTLGNLPVIYPYIQDNVTEALQARRRGRAVTVSHQTPPFAPSGLYEELAGLHELLHQYELLSPGAVKDATAGQLLQQAMALGLDNELGISPASARQDFAAFYTALHEHLHVISAAVTPLGLHTFGEAAAEEEVLLTVLQQLGTPFYQALELEPQEFLTQDAAALRQSEAMQLLRRYLLEQPSAVPEHTALQPLLEQARQYYRHLRAPGETEALLQALNGGFIPAGLGGDPVRNPHTSSGHNLYGFDPLKVPTEAAYAAGEREYQKLLAAYRQQHGAVPQKLAFSLWASETQRHLGIVEAQVLHALGLKPVWGPGGRLTALQIIPQQQLGRPRTDVVLQLTSVYRDQFDGFMRLLANAIDELAALDDGNPIASNSRALAQQLEQQGIAPAQAWRYARFRLFSNAPGDYGSGVTAMALDSVAWDDDTGLAGQFMQRLQYAYGGDDWGVKSEQQNLFASQLHGVEAAIMARSSHLHGLLSTDHPFEYLGGLAAAVRQQNGRSPALFVSDLRQSEGRVVAAERYLSEELRSRYLNPQWIKGMQAEGYAGALEMLNVTNNLFGWQVMAPETVRDDQWQAMHDVFIADQYQLALNEWFEQQQPAAQMQIIERMTEAIRKGYWDASEQVRQSLASRYLQLQPLADTHRGNAVTTAVLEQIASQYGLDHGAAASASQLVQGQEMREKPAAGNPSPASLVQLISWLLLLFILLGGIVVQHRRQQQLRKISELI